MPNGNEDAADEDEFDGLEDLEEVEEEEEDNSSSRYLCTVKRRLHK